MIHTLDDPNHVAQSKRLLATQVQLVLVRLLDVIQRQLKSGELKTPDDWQAQVREMHKIYFFFFFSKNKNKKKTSFQKSF